MIPLCKSLSRTLVSSLVGAGLMAGIAVGQGSAAPATPTKAAANSSAQIDAGEPRADTSVPPAETPAQGSTVAGRTARPGATAPSNTARNAPKASTAGSAAAPASRTGADRLDLGTATVTGDREQPKVMYIVPWKRSDIGEGAGKPMNSLLDEALAPVDRDEFKREVAYYDAIEGDAPQNGASAPAAKVR